MFIIHYGIRSWKTFITVLIDDHVKYVQTPFRISTWMNGEPDGSLLMRPVLEEYHQHLQKRCSQQSQHHLRCVDHTLSTWLHYLHPWHPLWCWDSAPFCWCLLHKWRKRCFWRCQGNAVELAVYFQPTQARVPAGKYFDHHFFLPSVVLTHVIVVQYV